MIPALNDLRIIELGRLILHEAHDPRRLGRLRERIEAERVQRDPVIVALYPEGCLVLDGAHRVHTLRDLGCRTILVQLAKLPEAPESWEHLLDAARLPMLEDVREVNVSEEPARPDRPLASIETAGGESIYVQAREKGLSAEVRALWGLQALYPEDVAVRRVDSDEPVELAEGEAIIRYRPFAPDELVEMVRSGSMLPAGITRFRIQKRILGVSFPLEKLKDEDIALRNSELEALIKRHRDADRIRYYGEPVVLFE